LGASAVAGACIHSDCDVVCWSYTSCLHAYLCFIDTRHTQSDANHTSCMPN